MRYGATWVSGQVSFICIGTGTHDKNQIIPFINQIV